jgi:predicted flavoprotein YhiN
MDDLAGRASSSPAPASALTPEPDAPALVIGAGPAGLMAAEMLAAAGWPVLLAEAKPSAGLKFLMAGKSGVNLTRDVAAAEFAAT